MEVDSEQEYLVLMRDHLSSLGMPPDVADPLSSEMADEVRISRYPKLPPGTMGLMFLKTYWVIRDEDLKLMDTLWAGILAAASVDFFHKSPTAAAITGMLAATFKLVRVARFKG